MIKYEVEFDGSVISWSENAHSITYEDGSRLWYVNGELHREDGPAIEHADGYRAWYLGGKKVAYYSKDDK